MAYNPGISLPALGVTSAYIWPPSSVRGDFVDPTVMRMLISWGYSSLVDTGGTAIVAAGIIDWDDLNDTPDEPPNVLDNGNLDWMWTDFGEWQNRDPSNAASLNFHAEHGSDHGMIDVSSKRRMGNDKGLLFTFVNDGDQAVIVNFYVRYLIKE